MTCNVIATGSSGNAVLLNEIVLVDCGVPFKTLQPYLRNLRLVLLTHRHGDHFKPETIRRISQERPTVRFACGPWMIEHLLQAGVPASRIDVCEIGEGLCYGGDFTFEPFRLFHDVDNCGWKIGMDGERMLYATDTGTMDGVEARGYDLYMIEANHTQAEIENRIQRKLESGEFIYEYRAAVGHLSREKADAWLAENAIPGKSKVVYLHGHKDEELTDAE